MAVVHLVAEGSVLKLPAHLDSLGLNGVVRAITDSLGFEIHSPGFKEPEPPQLPLVIEVKVAGVVPAHFRLIYEKINQVAPCLVGDILKALKWAGFEP